MALNSAQRNAIKNHPNIKWLTERGSRPGGRKQLLPAATIEQKIREALASSDTTMNCATNANIEDVARRCGHDWGNFYRPEPVFTGRVHAAAAPEILSGDRFMAQELRKIFGRTVLGRSQTLHELQHPRLSVATNLA